MEDEGIFQAVDVQAAGNDALGNLSGLAGIVGVQAHGNLQLEGVGQLGPLGQVSVVDDVLLGHHYLLVILEGGDVAVQFRYEQVVQLFHPVVLRGEGTALGVQGSFGVLDVSVDVDGVKGAIDGQDAAHIGIGLELGMLVGLDILVDIVPIGEHRDIAGLAVHRRAVHTVGALGENAGGAHLGPSEVQGVVIEPEQIVVGFEQGLGTGGQEGRFGRGDGIRLLVQFGKLVAARGEACYREQR